MHIRCPHCRHPIELIDYDLSTQVNCPSCGSRFGLATEMPRATTFNEKNAYTTPTETISYLGPSQRMIAHFTLIDELGVGAFGSVYKAHDSELDRTVAVKIPRRDQLTPEDTEQFLREARAAAQLSHPNIVSVHEVGRLDGTVYIVSDFVEGVSLADWLTGQLLTPREAAELCATVADALHHAHERGVVHRDLKPANILMDVAGQPHVTDFGLAKRDAGEITMTMEGRILGTPAYMAPEQARGDAHSADRRADIYSLGVILFELLTGERPFRGNSRMLLHQVIHEEAPSPRKFAPNVPRDLETICLKCLVKERERRFRTAQELAEELRRFARGEPIVSRPISRFERVWRLSRCYPKTSILVFISVLMLFVVAIGGPLMAFQINKARIAERQARKEIEKLARELREQRISPEEFDKAIEQFRESESGIGSPDAAFSARPNMMGD